LRGRLKILAHLIDTGHLRQYRGWDEELLSSRINNARKVVKDWMKENIRRMELKRNAANLAA